MDYLDPAKQARHRVILLVGYVLITVGIVIGALILVNQASGYGINKNGQVIQNGEVYFSSQPNPAGIYINGQLKGSTNTRLYIPGGIYRVSLARTGYNDWQRTVELNGGSVEHFDYPFLVPKNLISSKVQTYSGAPQLASQSPDRRWLLVSKPGSQTDFDLYDLKSPTKVSTAATSISLSDNLLSKSTTTSQLKLVSWADDNQRLLVEHDFDGKKEFIVIDRVNPSQSVNLNDQLSITPTALSLINKKYDQYYLYDAASQSLQTISLQSPDSKKTILEHVLAFQPYGSNTILYVTNKDAATGQVWLRMLTGSTSYNLHSLPVSAGYVLNLTQYSGTMYVAAGATNSNKVYVYQDPLGQLDAHPNSVVGPAQVLHIEQPNYVSFSDNAQFIVAENGGQFGVYDIENQKGYKYDAAGLDAPQPSASWMDGDRLTYVSGGKLQIFDYDHTNQHDLIAASSQYLPAFAPDYKYVYSLAQTSNGQTVLNQTALVLPADR